jgi:hypothetical protein
MIEKKIDTLGKIAMELAVYSDIDRSSTIYQNLINSGESNILKNRDILPELYKSMKFYDMSVREPEELFGIDFQNYFISSIAVSKKKEYAYGLAIKKIEMITKLIEEEIK